MLLSSSVSLLFIIKLTIKSFIVFFASYARAQICKFWPWNKSDECQNYFNGENLKTKTAFAIKINFIVEVMRG